MYEGQYVQRPYVYELCILIRYKSTYSGTPRSFIFRFLTHLLQTRMSIEIQCHWSIFGYVGDFTFAVNVNYSVKAPTHMYVILRIHALA